MKNIISVSLAGGGKTTRLISRIKEIGSNSDRILVISFTNSTCQDIINKIKDSRVNVMTLHSFAYSLIMKNSHIEEPLIFVQMFLWQYFQLKNLGSQTVSSLVESYFIFDNFSKDISFLSPLDQQLNQEFENLIYQIKKEKCKHSSVFFADIINIIKNDFEIFQQEISVRYDHLLVDEAQDLSYPQLELLLNMIEKIFIFPKKSFFIVGDKNQSIYSFQGSGERYYVKFLEKIKNICEKNNISICWENKKQTYRFGGQILKKVNSIFDGHTSVINNGEFSELNMQHEEIYEFLKNFCDLYEGSLEDVMILYERNTQFIVTLQEKLQNFGMQCKIFLQNNKIIEALQDICFFQQTNSEYYIARILQGPFVHYSEPEFFEKAIKKDWGENQLLDFLQERKSAYEILCYLKENVYLSDIDILVFELLLKESENYISLEEMILSIGDHIFIKKEGLKFSTIHSAKGLEAKIVFYLKQKPNFPRIHINLSPFFFSTEIKKNMKEESNNLEYVAISRAREKLYLINCED